MVLGVTAFAKLFKLKYSSCGANSRWGGGGGEGTDQRLNIGV